MRLTETGGYCSIGTRLAVGYALSPGRGVKATTSLHNGDGYTVPMRRQPLSAVPC